MSFRYDMRLSGSGGQGLILLGIILADAAGIYDKNYVAQTQSYGPEARGGSSKTEVIISDEEIDYPKAMKLDLLLAMNQKSCDDYYMDLKNGGILVVDSTFVSQIPVQKAYQIPFTRIAREKLKNKTVANIVALGAITKLTNIITPKAIEMAVFARVPKGTEKINHDALKAGMAAGIKARKSFESYIESEYEDEDT